MSEMFGCGIFYKINSNNRERSRENIQKLKLWKFVHMYTCINSLDVSE